MNKLIKTTALCAFLMVFSLTGCQKELSDDQALLNEVVATTESSKESVSVEASENSKETLTAEIASTVSASVAPEKQSEVQNINTTEAAPYTPPVFENDNDFYSWILNNIIKQKNQNDYEWFSNNYEICNAKSYFLYDINNDGRDDLFITGPIGVREMYTTVIYITCEDGYKTFSIDGDICEVGKNCIGLSYWDYGYGSNGEYKEYNITEVLTFDDDYRVKNRLISEEESIYIYDDNNNNGGILTGTETYYYFNGEDLTKDMYEQESSRYVFDSPYNEIPIPDNDVIFGCKPYTYVCEELGYTMTFYQEDFVIDDGYRISECKQELCDGEGYFIIYENNIVGSLQIRDDNTLCWDYDEPKDLVIRNSTFVIPSGTIFVQAKKPKYYSIWW